MKTIPELSVDAQVLAKRLEQLKVDETVSYAELTALIKRDVRNGARHVLATARRIVLRDRKMVFECVCKLGVKRLNDSDIASIHEHSIRHIHKTARNTSRKQLCADYEKLTNEEKVKLNSGLSFMGALSIMTTRPKIKQLENRVSEEHGKLPLAKTLEMFSK